MLLFVPIGLGIVVGLIILAITSMLKKSGSHSAKVPSYIGLLIALITFIISFSIKGFEDAAYGITAFVILIFSVSTVFYSRNHSY